MIEYDVYTDLDPDELTEVGLAVMQAWIKFASGMASIHGHRVENPTGRYADSIRLEQRSPNWIAIVADEKIAPEALYLETGHKAYDMKAAFPGRVFPMHRGSGGILNSTFGGKSPSMWAASRSMGMNGFARVPTHITPENAGSWIIPAMPAWSPASYLAQMVREGNLNV